MKSVSQRLPAALMIGILSVAGCGSGRVVLPFTLDSSTLAVSETTRDFGTTENAIRGISAILVRDLALPLPYMFTAYVYSDRHGFERGLIDDANVAPVRAAELSEFAVGIGKRRQLLLNDESGTARGREWYRLIAHELAHVSQIEMAQGEGRAEQWLAEGMAEWVAFNVLDRLGLDTVMNRRQMAVAGIRNHAALVAARLDLETLGNPRGFTVRHLREGSLPTYQLSFLMTDYLIRRHGFDGLVEYYRSFALGRARHEAFRVGFGQTLEEFEGEMLRYFGRVLR